jgi:hypothetical protein
MLNVSLDQKKRTYKHCTEGPCFIIQQLCFLFYFNMMCVLNLFRVLTSVFHIFTGQSVTDWLHLGEGDGGVLVLIFFFLSFLITGPNG